MLYHLSHEKTSFKMNLTYAKRILVLAVLGALVAIYLTYEHYEDKGSVCDISSFISCSVVNKSEFAKLLNVPIAILGLSWNIVLLIGSWEIIRHGKASASREYANDVALLVFLWCLAGGGFVIYLVVAEVIVGAICPFCTVTHILIVAALYNSSRMYSESKQSHFDIGKIGMGVYIKGLLRRVGHLVAVAGLLFIIPLLYFNMTHVEGQEQMFDEIELDDTAMRKFEDCFQSSETGELHFYGASTCSYCIRQKALLGERLLALVHYHECDAYCRAEYNIQGFPTWVLKAEHVELGRVSGVLTLDDIYRFRGCDG